MKVRSFFTRTLAFVFLLGVFFAMSDTLSTIHVIAASESPQPFSDLPSNPLYKPFLETFQQENIIVGYTWDGDPTGELGPKDLLKRSEFTKVATLVRLMEEKNDPGQYSGIDFNTFTLKTDALLRPYYKAQSGAPHFTDVPDKDENCVQDLDGCEPWFTQYINYAASKGLIKGYTAGNGSSFFDPEASILRIYALKMVIAENGNLTADQDPRVIRITNDPRLEGRAVRCLVGTEDYILANNGGKTHDALNLLAYVMQADRLDLFGNQCQAFTEVGANTPKKRADYLQQPIKRQEIARYFALTTTYKPLMADLTNDPTTDTKEEYIAPINADWTNEEGTDPAKDSDKLRNPNDPKNPAIEEEIVYLNRPMADMTIAEQTAITKQGRCCRSKDLYPPENCKVISYNSYSISEESDYNWITYDGPPWYLATNSWDACWVPYPDILNGYVPPPPTSDYEILRQMMQRRNEIFGNLDAYYLAGHSYEQTKTYGLGDGTKPSTEIDDVNDWYRLRPAREQEIYKNLDAYYRAGHDLAQTVEYGYSADKLPIENAWVIKWYEKKKAELEAIAARQRAAQRAAAYRNQQIANANAAAAQKQDLPWYLKPLQPFMPVLAPLYNTYMAPTVNKYVDIGVNAIIHNIEEQKRLKQEEQFKNDFPSIAAANYFGNNKDVQVMANGFIGSPIVYSTTPALEQAWTDFTNNKRVKGAVQLTLGTLQTVGGAVEVALGVGIATGGTATGVGAIPGIAGGSMVAVIGADNVVAGTTGMASGFWNIVSPDESEPVDLSFSPIGATIDATTPKGSDINNALHIGHVVLNVGAGVAGVGTTLINNADDVAGLLPKLWSGAKNIFTKNVDEVPAVSNKLKPDPAATGPHTTFLQKADGTITKYETWKPNPQNPTGFDTVKRVDMTGDPHYNKVLKIDVETPHVQGKDIPGGVRPAEPSEIPSSFSK